MSRFVLAAVFCITAVLPVAAQAPPPAPEPFFVDMWHDLPRFIDKTNVVTLTVGAGVAWGIHHEDRKLGERAANSEELNEWLDAGGGYGNGWVHFGAAFGTYAFGVVGHHEKFRVVGADLIQAQL